VDNKERLTRRNLLLIDIKCTNVTVSSEDCNSRDSYLVYKCKKGYRFENNQGRYFTYESIK
jgi:hypothetical protein